MKEMLQVLKMSEKMEMKGEMKVDLDKELVECNARLAKCKLKLAEHNHKLADYERKTNRLQVLEISHVELMIFSLGLLFGLRFSLADRVVDSLYYDGGK